MDLLEYIKKNYRNPNVGILRDLGASEVLIDYLVETSHNTNFNIVPQLIDGGGEDEGIILFNGPIAKTTMAELNYIDSDVFTDLGDKIKIIVTGLKIDEDEPINFTKNFIFDYSLNDGHTDPIININNKYYMQFNEYGENNYTILAILDLDHPKMSSFSCDNFKMILLQN